MKLAYFVGYIDTLMGNKGWGWNVVFTLPPVILEFNDRIMSSPGGGPDDELSAESK
ncbi:MAG: hypothetical protein M8349_06150 [ANME-2 cluster archaeon]|nr:hypothetical protein [ANME-2 cluster archaeon]